MKDSCYPQKQPCRDLEILLADYTNEKSDRKQDIADLGKMMTQLQELINKQDKRIALLEQQNKLTFWVYALITSGLVTVIIKMM